MKLYDFLMKHPFLHYELYGIKHIKDKKLLLEKIGTNKNSFNIYSNGEKNKGAIIYNINIDDPVAGFFAINRYVLEALYCADVMGFIPYISLVNTKYNEVKDGIDNMFEYYYQQNNGITIEDVKRSFAVVDYKGEHRRWLEDSYTNESSLLCGYEFDEELINQLADISKRKLFLKDDIRESINNDIKTVELTEKTIGIHYRGNAYKVGFYGHPVCLEIEDYYPYINECIAMGFNKIFIATDDNNALQKIKNKYSNLVTYYNDTMRSDNGIDVHDRKDRGNKTGRRLGYEVLRDVYTLSRCEAFICGKSQVSFAVFVERKANGQDFLFKKMIDHGIYKKELKKNVDKYRKQV